MYGNGFGYGYGGWAPQGGYGQQPMNNSINNSTFNRFNSEVNHIDSATQKPVLQVPWVNGEVGARAYTIAPNSTILLMDSDDPIFYIKTSDIGGKATIKAYKYEEVLEDSRHNDYILKSDLQKVLNDIEDIKRRLDEKDKEIRI